MRLLKRPSCPQGGLRVSRAEARPLDHHHSGPHPHLESRQASVHGVTRKTASALILFRDYYWCRHSCAYRITLLATSLAGSLPIDFDLAGTAPSVVNPLHHTPATPHRHVPRLTNYLAFALSVSFHQREHTVISYDVCVTSANKHFPSTHRYIITSTRLRSKLPRPNPRTPIRRTNSRKNFRPCIAPPKNDCLYR